MKVISDTAHGILDDLTVAIFALAPSILGLPALPRLCHTRSPPFMLA